MSFRGIVAKKILQTMGPEAWNEFWVALAQRVVAAEKQYKGTGNGKAKADDVKAWAHAHLAPILPDWSEATIFAWVDSCLEIIVTKSNDVLGKDWVSGVENVEAYFSQILEPLLDVDLDGDGVIGAPAAKAVTIVLALLLLSQPGPCHAQRRPLVEHYQSVDAPLPGPDAPAPLRPRSDDLPPKLTSAGVSPLSALAVSTWTGYRTNGKSGAGTWDAGLGVTLKASSTWQPSLLFGKGGAGAGVAYKRLGAMAFWDGSLTGGLYLRAFDF